MGGYQGRWVVGESGRDKVVRVRESQVGMVTFDGVNEVGIGNRSLRMRRETEVRSSRRSRPRPVGRWDGWGDGWWNTLASPDRGGGWGQEGRVSYSVPT